MRSEYLVILAMAFGASVSGAQSKSCEAKHLYFSAQKNHPIPSSGIWGGSATVDDEESLKGNVFFTPVFLEGFRAAKRTKLETFLYVEGKCGKTNDVNEGEEKKCKEKWESWDYANRTRRPGGGPLWQQYTLAQLRAARSIGIDGNRGVDHCEVDNIPDESLTSFLSAFEIQYRTGEITCKLVLKNVNSWLLTKVIEKFKNPDFISPFAIMESSAMASKAADLEGKFKDLKGSHASTIYSYASGNYGSAFKQSGIYSCAPAKRAGLETDSSIAFSQRN